MGAGRDAWTDVRSTLSTLLSADTATLRDNDKLRASAFFDRSSVGPLCACAQGQRSFLDGFSSLIKG